MREEKHKTLDQIQREAREEFDDKFSKLRGLGPYLSYDDVWLFIDSLIAQAYHAGRESLIKEEIERRNWVRKKWEAGEAVQLEELFICLDVGKNNESVEQ